MTAEYHSISSGLGGSPLIAMSIPIPRKPEIGDAARAEWDAIAAHLSEEVRGLAEEFAALCERMGALNCGSGCAVDDMGDDGVLFDWNDGQLPVLSVMISPGPQVSYAGKFKTGGRVSGTDSNLSLVAQVLTRMMEECGFPVQYTSHTPVLWTSVEGAAQAKVVQSYSSLPQTTMPFLFLLPPAR